MDQVQNKYCERLGIAVPRVESVAERGTAKLFHLMVVALLERGAPMNLDEIAERLEAAGVDAETGDVAYSLQKAWHGMEPVYRDAMGRFGLNLDASELGVLVRSVGLGESFEPPPPVPTPLTPSDDVPVSEEKSNVGLPEERGEVLSVEAQVVELLGVPARGGAAGGGAGNALKDSIQSVRIMAPPSYLAGTRPDPRSARPEHEEDQRKGAKAHKARRERRPLPSRLRTSAALR